MKRPTGILLLAIFLAFGILNTLYRAFLKNDSLDVLILEHYGLLWLGYLLFILILILNAISLYGLIKRKDWAVKALYSFFAVTVVETLLVAVLALQNTEAFQKIISLAKTNTEQMNAGTIAGMTAIYIGFYLFLTFYVHRKKNYFSSRA